MLARLHWRWCFVLRALLARHRGCSVPQAVPAWKKTLAWGFLITLDLFFGLYVVLFGLTQDKDVQQAWLFSLVSLLYFCSNKM